MKTFFERFVFLGVFLSMAMSFVACQSQVKEPSAYWSNDYEETREKAAKENTFQCGFDVHHAKTFTIFADIFEVRRRTSYRA